VRKSVKSLQLVLHECMPLAHKPQVSAAAFTKARKKLKHTAFIALNRDAVVATTYAHEHKRFSGHRLLAIDGSKVILPNTQDVRDMFGETAIKNKDMEGTYVCGLASVLYDVLNGIALDANLARGDAYEVVEAERHLSCVEAGDIAILDRGYCSYRMLASIAQTKADFVVRCHAQSFAVAQEMFTGNGSDDRTVTIYPSAPCRKKYGDTPYPASIKVRFVRVTLDTGEIEVLVTSLLDTITYPTPIFKDLYWKRWGIETFYGTLKNRLSLENFTGISTESVLQDFHVTIFLSGLESALTEDIDESLAQKETRHVQQVNKAVSIHAIKHRAFDLFASDLPVEDVVGELTELFVKSPTSYREDRSPPRKKRSARMLLNFWKRARKQVF